MRSQLGQRPFLPELPGGRRTRLWQWGQGNSLCCGGAAGFEGWRAAGATLGGLVESAAAADAGMATIAPQLGHLPFLPAVASGVLTGRPHLGQVNSILSGRGAAGTGGVAVAAGSPPWAATEGRPSPDGEAGDALCR